MRPITPKYANIEKVQFEISDKSKEILKQYAAYTKYSESEILDQLISEIIEADEQFVKHLLSKRYSKKIHSKIFSNNLEYLDFEKDVNIDGETDKEVVKFQ